MAYGNLNQRGDRITTKITTEKKKWLALWTLFLYRIGSHMLDFALDMALLREYWNKGHWWYFSLTFVFVIFPAAITSYCVSFSSAQSLGTVHIDRNKHHSLFHVINLKK